MTEQKNVFIELLHKTKRQGVDELLQFLERVHFYDEPASAKFHNNYPGGLLDHSLKVYKLTSQLNKAFKAELPEDSIIIVSLLHDLSKIGSYEIYQRNKKNEFDQWYKALEYRKSTHNSVTEDTSEDQRLLLVALEHGIKSAYIASQFIKLDLEETEAIANHMTTWGSESLQSLASTAYGNNKLAFLLHVADEYSTFYLEETFDEIPWGCNE